jgi:Cys-tRNA(Pro)/Cys-tRNA(Cys) deacylase
VKTNAVRILDQHKIAYRLLQYEVDESDLSATTVAEKIGLDAAQVFKTLVCRLDSRAVCFAVVPGNAELDTKVLAKALSERKAHPVALKEVQPLTGYVRGGVTVLGAKRPYPVAVDALALLYDEISVSAGVRGTQVLLHPRDYVDVTGARVIEGLSRAS